MLGATKSFHCQCRDCGAKSIMNSYTFNKPGGKRCFECGGTLLETGEVKLTKREKNRRAKLNNPKNYKDVLYAPRSHKPR